MAQLMLANGRLYKRLKMIGAARTSFRMAVRYADNTGSTARLAQGELEAVEDS